MPDLGHDGSVAAGDPHNVRFRQGGRCVQCEIMTIVSNGVLMSADRQLNVWQQAVQVQSLRILSGGAAGYTGPFTERVDAYLFVLALRNLIRAASWTRDSLESAGQAEARAALDRFDLAVPHAVSARDVLEHFDKYLAGVGNLQKEAKSTVPADVWHEIGVQSHVVYIAVTPDMVVSLDVRIATEAAVDLGHSIRQVVRAQLDRETVRDVSRTVRHAAEEAARPERVSNAVRRAAETECAHQQVGADALARLLDAHQLTVGLAATRPLPSTDDALTLAAIVEPAPGNSDILRSTPVVFAGGGGAAPASQVGPALDRIFELLDETTDPDEFTRAFLLIHPFRDGNGRVAWLLLNWLRGTLDNPVPLPDFDFSTSTDTAE